MKNSSIKILLSVAFFLVLNSLQLLAQPLDMRLFKEIKPRNIGPAGMSGRITAIDVVTENPQIIYAGSASGGLWKSESGGINWQPIFDSAAVQSIGAIAIDQKNPDIIWVGTGEGNPRNSVTGGYGLYRSLDAGKTWQLMGLEKTRNIHRIIVDKHNSNIVYIGAIGSSWGEHSERGVYKTTDGGSTWNKILYVNDKTGLVLMHVLQGYVVSSILLIMEYRVPMGEGAPAHVLTGQSNRIALTEQGRVSKVLREAPVHW